MGAATSSLHRLGAPAQEPSTLRPLLRLVDNGTLDADRGSDGVNHTFRSMHNDLRKKRPEWVRRFWPTGCAGALPSSRMSGGDQSMGDIFSYNRSVAETFRKSSERTPTEFVHHVLPIVLESRDSALIEGEQPRRDAVWSLLIKTHHPNSRDACLIGTAVALAKLARVGADLTDVIVTLRSRNTHVANHLLLALYRGGAARYANEAVALLCDEPWRFQCGYSDIPNWCAMDLIHEVAQYCTAEERESLETVIIGYVSPFERSKRGHKLAGRTRFDLLSAIPLDLLSTRAIKHFRELERKFSEPRGEPREMRGASSDRQSRKRKRTK